MRARGLFISLLTILICGQIFLSGCSGGGSNAPAPLSSEKAITAFSINSTTGTIDEAKKTISIAVPSLTNVYSMVATFTTTGVSVTIGTTVQASGVTANNFIRPLAYMVTAADGSTATYTVTVTINRAWHNPANLADNISPDGQNAYYPEVAMDNNGNAIIVWEQYNGANYHIYKSEYRNGVWVYPASLSDSISPDGTDAGWPQVAMDNNGNAIISWCQYDGSYTQIFKSEYRNGAWHHPANLSEHTNSNATTPSLYSQVAMDNNGNAIIVWEQLGHIFKNEYRSGVWNGPASSSDYIAIGSNPRLAMDNNGNAIIAWERFVGGTYYQIFKSEYRNGAWTYPASTSDHISPNGEDAHYPHVAMDNNGNAIIVWWQRDGTDYHVFKSEYRNVVWVHPVNLADNIGPGGNISWSSPRVAMDDNGNAIIVWYQDANGSQIFKSEYRNGVWVHPASLSDYISPIGGSAAYPRVAMNNNGIAIIVWLNDEGDGTHCEIFKSEYRSGVWVNPASLSDYISPYGRMDYTLTPQVAMDNNGNAIITWNQWDVGNQIFKSEYR